MNVKRSLENRIRGWLPKEPKLPNRASAKTDFKIDQRPQPSTQIGTGAINATLNIGFQTLVFAFFSFITIVQINAQNHILLTSQIGWIIAGLVAGSIFSAAATQRQLKPLATNNRTRMTLAGILLIVGAGILVFGIFIGVQFSNLPALTKYGLLTSLFASVSGVYVARYALFLRFERKNQMRIFQTWSGLSELIAIPKSETKSN